MRFLILQTKLQYFKLVLFTLMNADAPYALLEASVNISISNFCVSVDLKLTHHGTVIDDNFKTKFFHNFH